MTRLGRHSYGFDVVEKMDPRGREYYWIGGSEYQHEDIPGSDCNAVLADGLVSVTPLQLDLTDDAMLERVASWPVGRVRAARLDACPDAPAVLTVYSGRADGGWQTVCNGWQRASRNGESTCTSWAGGP